MAQNRVAFQGERGAFSEAAAHQLLGKSITPVACDKYELVFDMVEKRKADCAVIPIENSLVGSIHRYYDLLLERNLHVVGETQVRIVHCLIAPKGVALKDITKVYSHPVALDQCRDFFNRHPRIAPISYYDTAGAVKMLADSDTHNAAAIAGPHTAELYTGMRILKKSIEDEKSNYTRFLMLSRKPVTFKGPAKTSIVFSMKNMPGGLFKVLSVFALRDIDLTKIDSRPVRKKAWQYHFYLDFVGSVKDEAVKNALSHLAEITHFIRILGSYPKSL